MIYKHREIRKESTQTLFYDSMTHRTSSLDSFLTMSSVPRCNYLLIN